ncbi:Fe-S cluster assembly protein SufD [Inmirania thermothiophila]|uniref:Iron-regulated ABC transporter permease protein SufD n=1 Tax=Inmirania thermothiophila TaxID=1750597 RepID=A0A3N1Y195_9GAMM|nr:Fe-S cluster assembly protein SufD [Inmirania thermothiophila]ROR32595.1 iron-regulated ABC transporter permease protein SufD [Inmirania thermothiophila]
MSEPKLIERARTAHEALAGRLPGAAHPELAALRRRALDRAVERGLPTPRDEDWRYTDLRPLAQAELAFVAEGGGAEIELAPWRIEDLDGARLVFADGRLVPALSDLGGAAGVRVAPLASLADSAPESLVAALGADAEGDALPALNLALATDGLVLELDDGVALEAPVHVLYIATGEARAAHLRNLLRLGRGARATVIEHHVSLAEGAAYTNVVTDVVLAEAARLAHYRIQEPERGYRYTRTRVRQAAGSGLAAFTATFGGRITRNEILVDLEGEGARCELDGLTVLRGRDHADHHTRIEHRTPEATSRELYKGILDDRARTAFTGRVVVHPGAQQTDAEQANHNLLLSGEAEADARPQLEIYADDVRCSHGATVGQIDPRALFYLRSRGIDEASARILLTYGFAEELLERIPLPAIRRRLDRTLIRHMPAGERIEELL